MLHRHPLTRRCFVQGAASTLAFPLILPRSALGRVGSRPGPNERIGLGFIGMGIMNFDHLSRFLDDPAVRVLAVCDVDATRREKAAEMVRAKYSAGSESPTEPSCASFNDHRELLDRKDIDAVVIATPDHWHAIQVIDACNAGKDIYCEKPLSLTIHEAKAMIDAVRKHGRVFQTGSQQRTEYGGLFRKACEYVRSGRIGRALSINIGVGESSRPCDLPEEPMEPGLDWDRWLGPAPMRPYNAILSPRGVHSHYPRWRDYREYSGGTLTDMGAHHYDIAQWGMGMDQGGPIAVTPPSDPNARHGARLTYASGVEVIHGGPDGSTFVGTKGLIHINRDRLISVPESILNDPLTEADTHLPQWPDHHANWIDCIRTREKPICDVEVGARTITCCHLVNLAYWNRRPLNWNPEAWEFPGDAEANRWRDCERRSGYQLPSF